MSTIEVTYQPKLADLLYAARVVEGETWKRSSRIAAILLALLGGLSVYWGEPLWAVGLCGVAVAEWFNLLPLSVIAIYFQQRGNQKFREHYTLRLSPEELFFESRSIKTSLKWDIYTRFWETDRAFILSMGSGAPSVIPKAAFSTAADLDAARDLLGSVIPTG